MNVARERVRGSAIRELIQVAKTSHPDEACGLLFEDDTWLEVQNISESPTNSFEFDETELVRVMTDHFDLIKGIWHTHPAGNPHPSPHDAEFPYPGMRYFIITMSDMYEWEFADGGPYPIDPSTGERGAPQLAYPLLAAATHP